MMKRLLTLTLALLSIWLALPVVAAADVVPDSTRYDTATEGTWSTVVPFPASGDTVLWLGFEAWSAVVTRVNADCIVEPLEVDNRRIVDGPSWQVGRIYANPRADSLLFEYGADTLSTTNTGAAYCCQGILGVRVTGQGAAGWIRLQATAARQGVPLGSAGGSSGGGALSLIWEEMTSPEKPDTALAVDQIVYPEDLGQWEPILGQVGVTLTTGSPYPSNGWDAREAVLDAIYCTWSANFTDSIAVILRGGISMDASTHAGIDLDLRTDATCDSIVTYLEDNGGTGGYAYIPLTDRDGQYVWAPFKSFSFNKVGTGNVTGFKAYYVWRRLR